MKLLPKALVAGMLVAWPMSAAAHLRDGLMLYQQWLSYKNSAVGLGSYSSFDAGDFVGYVTGASDVFEATLSIPPDVQAAQLCQIVGEYLEEHPQQLHLRAAVIVLDALSKAFPKKETDVPFKPLEKERPPEK